MLENKTIANFELKETQFIKEINSEVNIYVHKGTGAKLIHLDADDNNKVFAVAFRTPPENSTGVAHIIEHSVLCGSKKFPSKEPFLDLAKGSLHTFLNAFTSSDATVYPIASMNDKNFKILTEVYLDAVFFPNILKIDEIFYQEGWHYDMEKPEDELSIKGVVYNEMKGAYSSPEQIIHRKLTAAIYPDTPYKHCSGGEPNHIPELSLEDFRDFHKKYYHPSNSSFFLYGKMDINEIFTLINDEALQHFDYKEIDTTISSQPLFTKPIEKDIYYPIPNEADEKQKTWFALSFLLDLKKDPALLFSFSVLSHLLLQTSAAPLKNAILKAEICNDVYGGFNDETLQPYFHIVLKDSSIENKETFMNIFFETLKDLIEKGIDKTLIEASLSIKEFLLREADMGSYPKGIVYAQQVLSEWIHGHNPIMPLMYDEVLKTIKEKINTDFFESLIKTYIIDNPHYVFITMHPEKGLTEKNHNELKEKLSEIKKNMSASEINDIITNVKKIKERQITPDTKEDLAKIPSISLSDIEKKAEDYDFIINSDKLTFHEHNKFTNGIVYLNLFFKQNYIPQHLLQYAKLLSSILGRVNTKKYDYIELSNLKNINTGGFGFSFTSIESFQIDGLYEPCFMVISKAMVPKTKIMIELLKEIILNTVFDDVSRIKEILNEQKANMEAMLMQAGHYFAEKRLSSYITEHGRFLETIDGVEYYFFLKELVKNFDTQKDNIIKNLYTTYKQIFNKNTLSISITAPEADLNNTKNYLNQLFDDLKGFAVNKIDYNFTNISKNEAFILPGMVQYVAKGYSFKHLQNNKIVYNGEMEVLSNFIDFDYMWNRIRVQGGAYGAFFSINQNGMVVANSYRDPNLIKSLNVYNDISKFLKTIDINADNFQKYIIGTIRKYDTPKTVSRKSFISDIYYLMGKNKANIQEQRDQILSANFQNFKKYYNMIDAVMNMNYFCVFGSAMKIKESQYIFDRTIDVLG